MIYNTVSMPLQFNARLIKNRRDQPVMLCPHFPTLRTCNRIIERQLSNLRLQHEGRNGKKRGKGRT